MSPCDVIERSKPACLASDDSMWSKKPTPVAMSAAPDPSTTTSTTTDDSEVTRSALPIRPDIAPPAAQHLSRCLDQAQAAAGASRGPSPYVGQCGEKRRALLGAASSD